MSEEKPKESAAREIGKAMVRVGGLGFAAYLAYLGSHGEKSGDWLFAALIVALVALGWC